MRRRFHLHQSTTAAKVLEASAVGSVRMVPGALLETRKEKRALPILSWALISAVQI